MSMWDSEDEEHVYCEKSEPSRYHNIFRHLPIESNLSTQFHVQDTDTKCHHTDLSLDDSGCNCHKIGSDETHLQPLTKHEGIDSSDNDNFSKGREGSKMSCGILSNRKFRTALYVMTYLLAGIIYYLPVSFYPQIARDRGMTLIQTGVVFSIFELVVFITSPIIGSYLTTIGAKRAFTAGIIVAGTCTILFGTLCMYPPGVPFFVLSILFRSVAAVGFSSILTSVMTAVCSEYPENVATAISMIEVAFGIGTMVGPSIGGILYSSGGFGTPFYVVGGIVLVDGIIVYFLLPAPRIDRRGKAPGSLISLLQSPMVVIAALSTIVGATGFGFIEPTLSQHLEQFGLSTIEISLIFVIMPSAYTVSSPLVGYLSDSKEFHKEFIVIGQFVFGIGFLFVGPCKYLPFLPNELWTVTLGLVIVGLTYNCSFIPNIKCHLIGAMSVGFDDTMDTHGMVSGLATSVYSFGAFLGPGLGGFVAQTSGFEFAYTTAGLLNIGTSFAAMAVFMIQRFRGAEKYRKLSMTIESDSD